MHYFKSNRCQQSLSFQRFFPSAVLFLELGNFYLQSANILLNLHVVLLQIAHLPQLLNLLLHFSLFLLNCLHLGSQLVLRIVELAHFFLLRLDVLLNLRHEIHRRQPILLNDMLHAKENYLVCSLREVLLHFRHLVDLLVEIRLETLV